jgi:hypothetical protein
LDLINPELKKKKKKYSRSGTLNFTSVKYVALDLDMSNNLIEFLIPLYYRVTPVHSFVDYIKGGCQINLLVAVDFTVSTPYSLRSKKAIDDLASLSSVYQIVSSVNRLGMGPT